MSYMDSPEFRRQYSAASDTGVKLIAKLLTSAFTGIINAVRLIVGQVFGK